MNIVLVTPPKEGKIDSDERVEPIGISYLAAYLRHYSYSVFLEDAILFNLPMEELSARVISKKPDLIGISVIGPNQILPTIALSKSLRNLGYSGHITIGGIGATFIYEELLKPDTGINSVVRGEGEYALHALVQDIEKHLDWHSVNNVAYRDGTEIILNPMYPLIADLDTLPSMARDFMPYVVKQTENMPTIITSRGCGGNCIFCTTPNFYALCKGRKTRTRDIHKVVSEIKFLAENYNIRKFRIFDESFIQPGKKGQERILTFAQCLKELPYNFEFFICSRVLGINEKILKALKKAGLVIICVGIESGCQKQLDYFSKGVTVRQNRKVIEILKKVQIPWTRLGCILFDPYCELWMIKESLELFKESGCFSPTRAANILQILPGTPVVQSLLNEHSLKGTFNNYFYEFKDVKVAVLWKIVSSLFAEHREIESFLSSYKIKWRNRKDLFAAMVDLERKISRETIEHMEQWITFIERNNPLPDDPAVDKLIFQDRKKIHSEFINLINTIAATKVYSKL